LLLGSDFGSEPWLLPYAVPVGRLGEEGIEHVARGLGLDPGVGGADRLEQQVAARLGDEVFHRRLMDQLSPAGLAVLELLTEAGGILELPAVFFGLQDRFELSTEHVDGAVRELEALGLLVVLGGPREPAEMLSLLREARPLARMVRGASLPDREPAGTEAGAAAPADGGDGAGEEPWECWVPVGQWISADALVRAQWRAELDEVRFGAELEREPGEGVTPAGVARRAEANPNLACAIAASACWVKRHRSAPAQQASPPEEPSGSFTEGFGLGWAEAQQSGREPYEPVIDGPSLPLVPQPDAQVRARLQRAIREGFDSARLRLAPQPDRDAPLKGPHKRPPDTE
jgi:hypothetical protein